MKEVKAIKVTVKLFATLRNYGEIKQDIDYPEGTTPQDVIVDLKLPADEVAIIMINGRHVKLDAGLMEGDSLALFPAVGGG